MASSDMGWDESFLPVPDPYHLYQLERSAVFMLVLSNTPYYPPKVHAQLAVCILLKTPVIVVTSVARLEETQRALLPELASANVICITDDVAETTRVSKAIADGQNAPTLKYQPPRGLGPWKLVRAHEVQFLYCQACGRMRFSVNDWMDPTYYAINGHRCLCSACAGAHATTAHVCDIRLHGDYGPRGLTLPNMLHTMVERNDGPTMRFPQHGKENTVPRTSPP